MRTSSRSPDRACLPAAILAYDIETISPQVADGSFPPWPTHQPVAIGFAEARRTGGSWTFDIDALVITSDGTDEAAMIREADRRMAAVQMVTSYNGRQFDALVLRLAAQRQRLWGLKALADHAAANRFGGEHADLADLYASHGRKVGLASICDEIGITVKSDVAGGDVAALWDAGETERIRRYVMEDAVATLCLYLAWSASRSAEEALVTRPMAALARHRGNAGPSPPACLRRLRADALVSPACASGRRGGRAPAGHRQVAERGGREPLLHRLKTATVINVPPARWSSR